MRGVVGPMPPKINCPVCGSDMRGRSLLSYYSLKPYRVCPDCNGKYTTDSNTKKRQIPIIVLTLIALGCAIAISVKGFIWLLPTIISNIILWVYVGYVVSKVSYVKYQD